MAAADVYGGKDAEEWLPGSSGTGSGTKKKKSGEKVQVFVRFRPVSRLEVAAGGGEIVQYDPTGQGVTLKHPESGRFTGFAFQHVFPGGVSQAGVYTAAGQPVLEAVLGGVNACVMCYGQTASGKTYTMFGPPAAAVRGTGVPPPDMITPATLGVIPRLVRDLFAALSNPPANVRSTVKMSFIEVYKEEVIDLLIPTRAKLVLRDFGDYCITNATEVTIGTLADFVEVIGMGNGNRATAATNANARSSRSHAVVQIMLSIEDARGPRTTIQTSVLNLVDLAGSERFDQTGGNAARQAEARIINTSLLALASVIGALADAAKNRRRGHVTHVPYRASKLTQLLKASFGGNTVTHLIMNASPHQSNYRETMSTLRYGDAAAKIKNKPKANVELSASALRAELALMLTTISAQKRQGAQLQAVLSKMTRVASELLPRRVHDAAAMEHLMARYPVIHGLDPTLEFSRILPAFVLKEILFFATADTVSTVCATCTKVRSYLTTAKRAPDFWVGLCRRDFDGWKTSDVSVPEEGAPDYRNYYLSRFSESYRKRQADAAAKWDDDRSRVFHTGAAAAEGGANPALDAVLGAPTREQLERGTAHATGVAPGGGVRLVGDLGHLFNASEGKK